MSNKHGEFLIQAYTRRLRAILAEAGEQSPEWRSLADDLTDRVAVTFNGLFPWKCGICNRAFKTPTDRCTHTVVHHGARFRSAIASVSRRIRVMADLYKDAVTAFPTTEDHTRLVSHINSILSALRLDARSHELHKACADAFARFGVVAMRIIARKEETYDDAMSTELNVRRLPVYAKAPLVELLSPQLLPQECVDASFLERICLLAGHVVDVVTEIYGRMKPEIKKPKNTKKQQSGNKKQKTPAKKPTDANEKAPADDQKEVANGTTEKEEKVEVTAD